MVRLTAALALAVVMSGPAWPGRDGASEDEGSTAFELDRDGGVIVPVMLNGRGPFRFLLDTGSTHSAVSDATARAVGAPAVARAFVGSAAGAETRVVVQIDHAACGPVELTDLRPSVLELDLAGSPQRLDGLLGQDALAQLRYTIDFRRRRLLWWPGPSASDGGSAIALEPSEGRFLVALPQRTSVLRLVPDTGSSTLVLYERSMEPLPGLTLLPELATLAATTASLTVRRAMVAELLVGRSILRDVPAVVIPRRPDPDGSEGDGLLPLHLFERVTFDGPHRLLVLAGRFD